MSNPTIPPAWLRLLQAAQARDWQRREAEFKKRWKNATQAELEHHLRKLKREIRKLERIQSHEKSTR